MIKLNIDEQTGKLVMVRAMPCIMRRAVKTGQKVAYLDLSYSN